MVNDHSKLTHMNDELDKTIGQPYNLYSSKTILYADTEAQIHLKRVQEYSPESLSFVDATKSISIIQSRQEVCTLDSLYK